MTETPKYEIKQINLKTIILWIYKAFCDGYK